jgi:hypothetical protein
MQYIYIHLHFVIYTLYILIILCCCKYMFIYSTLNMHTPLIFMVLKIDLFSLHILLHNCFYSYTLDLTWSRETETYSGINIIN